MNDRNIYNSNSKIRTTVFSAIAVIFSLLAATLRTLSLLFFYDGDIGYYISGEALPIISNAFYAVSIAALLALTFLYLKPSGEISLPSALSKISALIPVIAFCAYAVKAFAELCDDMSYGITPPSDIVTIICALCVAGYFLLIFLGKASSALTLALGTVSILNFALWWIFSYLDFSIPMNSPDKLFFHLACVAAALFIFNEVRSFFSLTRPKLYFFSAATSLTALSASSIPSLIGKALNIFRVYTLTFEDIALLSIFIYAIFRLFSLRSASEAASEISDEQPEDSESASHETK